MTRSALQPPVTSIRRERRCGCPTRSRTGLAVLTGGQVPVDPAYSRCLQCERKGHLREEGDHPDLRPDYSVLFADLRSRRRDRPAPSQPTGCGTCDQGRRHGDGDTAENVDRPMHMRGDPRNANQERDGDQDDTPPSGVEEDADGQKHAGDHVIGGEAIVRRMRKERSDVVNDEGALIDVESPAELDKR